MYNARSYLGAGAGAAVRRVFVCFAEPTHRRATIFNYAGLVMLDIVL